MKLRSIASAALLVVATCVAPAAAQSSAPQATDAQTVAPASETARWPQTGQHAYTFNAQLPDGRAARLNYLLFLPASYGQDPEAKWPLLVFLHGSREVGRDINRVRRAILPRLVEENPDFPFIVVSPQSPSLQNGWYPSLDAIEALLDELQATLAIDPDRIYLTGLSMGGYGAWALAMDDPDRFAAIAPVVGGYFFNPKQLCELKDKPIWVFGAKRDRNVPLRESERVVNALRACGGQPRFTVFENADHDLGWELAYTATELFEWLLQQRRAS
ncbi:MAG: prolyl oligopeptidase family serine peptidase [Anaerolineae bacterium]|nr:prolyl oligopeptidase family serine peptidase [Anaerolineae bacterium]